MPDTIHFDRRGKRTQATATLYVGNLEFKASTKDLKEALDREFHEIHVEDVIIPRKDSRSRCYAFVALSWAKKVDPSDICTFYSEMIYVKSRQIYLPELDSKNDTASSDDRFSSEYINNMDQMIED